MNLSSDHFSELRCDERTAAHDRQTLLLGRDNKSSPTKLLPESSLWSLRCHFVLWAHFKLEMNPFPCPTQQLHWLQKNHSIFYQSKARQTRSFPWGQSFTGTQGVTIWSPRLFWILEASQIRLGHIKASVLFFSFLSEDIYVLLNK